MAYSTQSDILERLDQVTLVQLTDRNGTGQADASLVANAIAGADALIDSLVSPVYRVPLSSVPPVIREHSATIAVYRLHLYRSIDPGVWKDAYAKAVEFLQLVAERKATLEGVSPAPAESDSISRSSEFSSAERKFSRETLKEW